MMKRRKQSEHTHHCHGIPFSHSLNANNEYSCKHFRSSTPLRGVVEKDQSLFTQRKPVWIHSVSWINQIQWWDKIHNIFHGSDLSWKKQHSTWWCLWLNLCSAINEASDSIDDVQSPGNLQYVSCRITGRKAHFSATSERGYSCKFYDLYLYQLSAARLTRKI